MKSLLKLIAVSCIATFSLMSCSDDTQKESAENAPYQEGKHWSELKEPIEYTLANDQDGIIWEIFSYSCAHCNAYEADIERWRANTPKNIGFEPVPVYWNSRFETQALAFYTAKVLKLPEESHKKLFDAIHIQRVSIGTMADFAKFYSQFGVTQEQFIATSQSFVVKGMVEKAQEISAKGKVEGTPTLIVNGKYKIDTNSSAHRSQWLDVARYLVERDAKK